jgi:uncharacterized membrane protein required for colicin V production
MLPGWADVVNSSERRKIGAASLALLVYNPGTPWLWSEAMHWLDITLLIVLGLGLLLGAWSGLLWQVSRVVTLCVALYVGIFGHPYVAQALQPYLPDWAPWMVSVLAFVATVLVTYLVLFGTTWIIDRWLRKRAALKLIDRVLGAGIGVVTLGLLAGGVLFAVAVFFKEQTKAELAQSYLAPPLLTAMEGLVVLVPEESRKLWSDSLEEVKRTAVEKAEEAGKAAAHQALPDALKPRSSEKKKP